MRAYFFLVFFLVVLTSSACNALDAKGLRDGAGGVKSWISSTYNNFKFVGTMKSPQAGTQVFFVEAPGAARNSTIHYMITCYELEEDGHWYCIIPGVGSKLIP